MNGLFDLLYSALIEEIKGNILYNIPLNGSIERNLFSLKTTEGNVFQFDFKNGKIEKVYVNGVIIHLTCKEKYELSLLAIS